LSSSLRLEHLTVYYQKQPVLWDVNLEIPAGKLVAIVGPNGAGKSTLLKTIIGSITPLSGTISCLGTSYNACKQHIAYVPQKEIIDWDFPITVLEVVLMGRYHQLGLFKWTREADKEAALEALRALEIEDLADKQIGELSGGQQQRVFMARALVQDAKMYLLDEPFTAVDASTEAFLIEILKKLRQKGKTIVVVHHDLESIEHIFDWIVLLNNRVVAAGAVQDVFNLANVSRTYGKKEEIFAEITTLFQKKKRGV
jgi:manganese/zinc/iron transport system ATP- binding protein